MIRDLFLTALGVLALVAAAVFIWYTAQAFLLFFAAALFTVFFSGFAGCLRRVTGMSNEASLSFVLIFMFVLIAIALLFVGPAVAQQSSLLGSALPRASKEVLEDIRRSPLGSSAVDGLKQALEASSTTNLQSVINFAGLTIRGMSGLFFAVAIAVFIAFQPELYRNGILSLFPPSNRNRAAQVLDELDFTLWWWLIGQFCTMATVGILVGAGLTALGVPLSGTLGLIAGLLAFIPSLGPLISVIPAMILGFSMSPATGLWVALLYASVQLLEANLISPLVQLRAISLPPACVLGAELIMGILFGGFGLAVAAPFAATCLVLVNMLYVQDVLGEAGSVPSECRSRSCQQKLETGKLPCVT